MYCKQRYRGNRGTEKRSRDQVIQIWCDNARDCSIMSGNVPRGPEMDLGCHGYDKIGKMRDNNLLLHLEHPELGGARSTHLVTPTLKKMSYQNENGEVSMKKCFHGKGQQGSIEENSRPNSTNSSIFSRIGLLTPPLSLEKISYHHAHLTSHLTNDSTLLRNRQ